MRIQKFLGEIYPARNVFCFARHLLCYVTSADRHTVSPVSRHEILPERPARHNALYNLTEFSTGTQESSDVAQMKQGGADGRTLFSNE